MKNRLFIAALLMLFCVSGWAAKTKKTCVQEKTVGDMTVRVEFYNDGIVRVMKYPAGMVPQKKSYSVILEPQAADGLSACMKVDVDAQGRLTFTTREGKLLLRESGEPTLEKRTNKADEGKFRIAQSWQLDSEEDVFGLGQLRDEAMSWRGREMEIWNHNTYISIPYFTSEKGYGLYWDNAGKSRFKSSVANKAEGQTVSFSSEVGACIDYYFMYRDGTQDG